MFSLEEKQEHRLKLLHHLYEVTGGDRGRIVSMWEVGAEVGLGREEIGLAMQYLVGEHLAKYEAMGGEIAITHDGVREVEAALSEPDEPTTYFPPAVNILNIRNNIGSPIVQGSPGAQQEVAYEAGVIEELVGRLEELRARIGELELGDDDEVDAIAQIDTAMAQARSKQPDHGIIRRALIKLQPYLAAGAAAGHGAEHVPALLAFVRGLLG
jgi:hypothetical protein